VRKQGVSYRITVDEQVAWGEVCAKLSGKMLFEAERHRYTRGGLMLSICGEFVTRVKAEGKYLARLIRYLERGDPSLIA